MLIDDPAIILPVALDRLPKACNVYNMILMAMKIPGYREHVQFFAVNGDTDPLTSWIIATDQREVGFLTLAGFINLLRPSERTNAKCLCSRTMVQRSTYVSHSKGLTTRPKCSTPSSGQKRSTGGNNSWFARCTVENRSLCSSSS